MIERHQRATQTGPTSQQTAGVIEREGGTTSRTWSCSTLTTADPLASASSRRRQEVPDCPPQRSEDRLMAVSEARLKTRYAEEIRLSLVERLGYTTPPMQAPRILKVTVNMGVGDAKQDSKVLEAATHQLATITGQRPNVAGPASRSPSSSSQGDARGPIGDPPWRSSLRISGPVVLGGDSANP